MVHLTYFFCAIRHFALEESSQVLLIGREGIVALAGDMADGVFAWLDSRKNPARAFERPRKLQAADCRIRYVCKCLVFNQIEPDVVFLGDIDFVAGGLFYLALPHQQSHYRQIHQFSALPSDSRNVGHFHRYFRLDIRHESFVPDIFTIDLHPARRRQQGQRPPKPDQRQGFCIFADNQDLGSNAVAEFPLCLFPVCNAHYLTGNHHLDGY